MKRTLPLILALLLPLSAWSASVPAPVGTGGAVSSADPLATAAGLEILRAGGNAVDAAVATALALAVVYPEAGNLGGGGFAVVRMGGDLSTLDFREIAPAKPGGTCTWTPRASRWRRPRSWVPWPRACRLPGRPPRAPAPLRPAALAQGGRPRPAPGGRRLPRQPLSPRPPRQGGEPQAPPALPETARVWFPEGEPPAIGSVLKLPDLAATLDRYARQGPKGITEGPVAAAVEKASDAHGGVLTAADLAAYKPEWRAPLTFEAFGWKLVSMPLPSWRHHPGPALGILEKLEWGKLPRFGADRDHLLAETLRRSFADRFLLADPATTQATEAQLLAADWLDRRAKEIDPRQPRLPPRSSPGREQTQRCRPAAARPPTSPSWTATATSWPSPPP